MNKGLFEGVATELTGPQLSTGLLNDALRQQLSQLGLTETPDSAMPVTSKSESEKCIDSMSGCIVSAVRAMLSDQILDVDSMALTLESLFDQLYQVYQQANIDPALRKRQFIARHGLVMSPDYCVTTQKDTLRVRAFIRGADQAIADLRGRRDDCLHIVYPACGPFAPLLLPLIAYYKETGLYDENDIRLTLIDMQPGAIESLKAVVHAMGIAGFIHDIICQDACEYQTSLPIHMVVLEAMQHGFSREGHLPIARHFATIMEVDGVFLPQEVILRAVLSVGQKEFVEQWQAGHNRVNEAGMQQSIIDERMELGDILRLTPESLRALTELVIDKSTCLIECAEVAVPELPAKMDKPLLLICTRIQTYKNEYLGEYDSGITHPLPDMHVCVNFVPHDAKPGDLLVKAGDTLKFYYRLNGLPGFLATLAV